VAKGYTTNALVGEELGVALTMAQQTQVDGLITQAESVIDALAGTAWMETSPVTFEPHVVAGPFVELLNRPVTAVSAARTRALTPGATPETLVAGVDYELLDAARGTVLLANLARGAWVEVSYTFAAPAPGVIQRAACVLVAEWMRSRLGASTGSGFKAVAVGDVSVQYDTAGPDPVPDGVRALVVQARRPIFV
jgi:hypothetical protein